MAVPRPINVNMLGFQVTIDFHPRTKNGQPPQSTTGVARTSSSHLSSSLGMNFSGAIAGIKPPMAI